MAAYTIGDVARHTGIKVPTLRYYEQIGLIAAPVRSAGNQRVYDAAAVRRLIFIRHARQLGFGLDQIRQMLQFADEPDRPCAEVDAIAREHLRDVESRIRRLQALKKELGNMIGACARGVAADCRILETLADHDKCLSKEH